MLDMILTVAALLCFLGAAFKFSHPRIDLIGLGLACWILTLLVP